MLLLTWIEAKRRYANLKELHDLHDLTFLGLCMLIIDAMEREYSKTLKVHHTLIRG